MSSRRAVRFETAVCVVGLPLFLWLVKGFDAGLVLADPWGCGVLGGLLVLTGLRPVRLGIGSGQRQVALSGAFALALVFIAPLSFAVGVQALALGVERFRRSVRLSRLPFDVAQSAIALGLAGATYWALASPTMGWTTATGFTHRDLTAAVSATVVFFVAANLLGRFDDALRSPGSVFRQLAADARITLATSVALLLPAPVIAYAISFSPWLVVLLASPLAAVGLSARLAAQAQYQALHDVLTGLPNRRSLSLCLDKTLSDGGRRGFAGLLLIDLDRFKEVNDTLGHAVGDELLSEVAARLSDGLGPDHLAARLGGDEFAILLPGADTPAVALAAAKRVRALLDEPVEVAGTSLSVDATIGAALAEPGTDADTLLRHADVALYQAKDNRGSAIVYDPARDPHSVERLQLLSDLKGALGRGEFIVHYQPKADAATGEIVGAEALLRWIHPTRGLLSPATFIPLLERTALMGPVTLEVIRQALTQAQAWPTYTKPLTVAVNLSAAEITDLELPRNVARLLASYDVNPTRLTLEVTETTIMTDPNRAAAVLRDLRQIGVSVSIDDFGTGYSSLDYLSQFCVDEIKVDRSFVDRMQRSPQAGSVVRSIIQLGHSLGLQAVAEGVETAGQWQSLNALGCDVIQGYHLSRPLDPETFTAWLATHHASTATIKTAASPIATADDGFPTVAGFGEDLAVVGHSAAATTKTPSEAW